MKINFILPPVNMSGGLRVVAIYAKKLAERGHDVVIISPPPSRPTLRTKVSSVLKGDGWPENPPRFRKSHFDGMGLDHRVLHSYRPPTDRDVPDADVVIATWWETAEWVNALSPSKGTKVYFVQGYEVFDYLPVARCKATYRMPLKKITIAKWLVDLMRTEYGDDDVTLVNNAVDLMQFYAPFRSKQLNPTIGFLNHSAPTKGLDIVLDSIAKLRTINPRIRAVSFGSEPLPERVAGVEWLTYFRQPDQEAIRDIYSSCDVWVTASRSEGFNLCAMEAMACRTPVVSTRTGWPAEAIVDGHNGFLVDVGDIDQLVEATLRFLNMSEESWKVCSANAFATVEKSSWDNSCRLFEQALLDACDMNRGCVADHGHRCFS